MAPVEVFSSDPNKPLRIYHPRTNATEIAASCTVTDSSGVVGITIESSDPPITVLGSVDGGWIYDREHGAQRLRQSDKPKTTHGITFKGVASQK